LCEVSVCDTTCKDRAITLLWTVPVAGKSLRWLGGPRESTPAEPGREYLAAARFRAGSNGRLSRYPFAAVADKSRGIALGMAPLHPAFCRMGYNAGTGELFAAWDIGLTPEKPRAELEFCRFTFEPEWGVPLPHARAGPVDAVRQDQPGSGVAGFRLQVQGRQR
jgi:hypothetical protein